MPEAKYDLIIAEKPSAAKKIAQALADGKVETKKVQKVSYFRIAHDKKEVIVCSAVGHLYGLQEKDKKGWTYPTFKYEWKPTFETNKTAKFTKPYVAVIKKLAKGANEITVATDYDAEGSVIGFNCVKFICKRDDARRMKFSTLTKDELRESYANASKHLDFPQIKAGLTRHELDWLWGINLSRALTLAIKNATQRFKILSTGRVQGPALSFLAKKEAEIAKFIPEPYWEIPLEGTVNKKQIQAKHKANKFTDKKKAQTVFKKVKGKDGVVTELKTAQKKQAPPSPFDLTSLQIEAHRVAGIPPKQTLELAQDLYSSSYISYPRTSSQKLPPSIGYQKILKKLSKRFPKECKYLLDKKSLKPNEGKKHDPAHPAIYPTGDLPKSIQGGKLILYELIVRRFFATFDEPAVRETMTISIDVEKEPFIAKGTRTVKRGWYELYTDRFVRSKEEELPAVKKGDKVTKTKITLDAKETQPPKRYTEASIIKALEKANLGTKATRATIIQNLHDRSYIEGKSIKVTDLGMQTVKTLNKYAKEVIDEKLTRRFEEEMEKIIEEKQKPEAIIDDAKGFLDKTLTKFKKHETKIGQTLGKSHIETQDKLSYLGKCPECDGNLHMRRGRFGMFAACSKYPDCKVTASLPAGKIESLNKECETCSWPMIKLIKVRSARDLCLNINCKTRDIDPKIAKEEKFCPKCQSQLVLKKSLLGAFWACPGFPKCRHIEAIDTKE